MATPSEEPTPASTLPQPRPGGEAGDPAQVQTPSHALLPVTGRGLLTATEAAAGPPPPPGGVPCAGRYEFLGELARGGMGVVCKVRDRILGRVVALKTLRAGEGVRPEGVVRFRREAEAVARLDHPHIIRLHEFGEEGGRPYFTMPLAEGGSLAGRAHTFRADPRAAAVLLEKVAGAVGHAHSLGVLHRDLKPSNVLLDAAGEPLVADFGLVKFVDAASDLTQTGDVLGTPSYMAPEQAAGRIDEVGARTDVWALGAILYELLTGRLPFPGRNREEVLHNILTTTPARPRELNPDLDPALEAVVRKCLRHEPGERYPTAEALAADLACWLHGGRPEAGSESTVPLRGVSRRRWLRRALAMGGLVAAGGLAAILGVRGRRPEDDPDPIPRRPERGISFIDAKGPHRELRWLAQEGKTSTGRHPRDGAFSVRTQGFALVELASAPPWEGFRLEAEIRDDGDGPGTVGITFAQRRYDGPLGAHWCFCRLAFADRNGGVVGLRGCRWEGFTGSWSVGGTTRNIPPPWEPRTYRKLAVEVTTAAVRVFWEGECQDRIAGADLCHEPRLRGGFGRVGWEDIRGGGVGICIDRRAASFRRVALEPLA